jgi:type II secretory pathway pseudopilin PulG
MRPKSSPLPGHLRPLLPVPRRPARVRGFTVVELIAIVLLLGILSAIIVPRLNNALSLGGSAWRDQVVAALKTARSLAQGHRRLVCATVASGTVSLAIAATNPPTSPANGCGSTLAGPDGGSTWARDSGSHATSQSPSGTLYFQPDGRITSDGAGASTVSASITIAGETAITVNGVTGLVD